MKLPSKTRIGPHFDTSFDASLCRERWRCIALESLEPKVADRRAFALSNDGRVVDAVVFERGDARPSHTGDSGKPPCSCV